jgi:hypothetical protein
MKQKQILDFIERNYYYDCLFLFENSSLEWTQKQLQKYFAHREEFRSKKYLKDEKESEVIDFFSFVQSTSASIRRNSYTRSYGFSESNYYIENIFEQYQFSENGLRKIINNLWDVLILQDVIYILKNQKVSQRLFHKLAKKYQYESILKTYVKNQNITIPFIVEHKNKIDLSDLCCNSVFYNLFEDCQINDVILLRNVVIDKISEVGLEEVDTRVLLSRYIRGYYHENEIQDALIKKIIKLEKSY